MSNKYPLRKTAKICDISLPTAFVWRHKILDTPQAIMNETTLNGVVEADETFLVLYKRPNVLQGILIYQINQIYR